MSDNSNRLSDPGKESLIYNPSKVSWAINSFVLETTFSGERKFLYFTILMMAGFLTWGFFTTTAVIVNSDGFLVNKSPPLPITVERNFYVRKVFVKDGQNIKRGHFIVSAKDELLEIEMDGLHKKFQTIETNLKMISSGSCGMDCSQTLKLLADTPLTSSQLLLKDTQIRHEALALEADLKNLTSKLTSLNSLESNTASIRMKIRSNSQKISEIERRRATQVLAMEYEQLKSERASYMDQLKELEDNAKNSLQLASGSSLLALKNLQLTLKVFKDTADVISPIDGRVSIEELRGEGQLISPGMTLVKLLPDDNNLAINLEVMNQDISKITPGQGVKLDIEAFPSSEYGVQEAKIDFIPVHDTSSKQSSNYKVMAKLKSNIIEKDEKKYILSAGMKVKAKILIRNEKTIIYILKKVLKLKDEVLGG
jgi:multidrug efflux pump subunit AcrA (membrane-fusion protein)